MAIFAENLKGETVRGKDDVSFRGHTRMIICCLDTGMLPGIGTHWRAAAGRGTRRDALFGNLFAPSPTVHTVASLPRYRHLREVHTHDSSRNVYETFPLAFGCVKPNPQVLPYYHWVLRDRLLHSWLHE